MCGIGGILKKSTDGMDCRKGVERMQLDLAHRGPDDCGLFVSKNGHCALAHTRLSILDLSTAGHQPMAWGEIRNSQSEIRNQSFRYWIVFNGEIYNYLSLREELDEAVRREGTSTRSGEQGAGSWEAGRISDFEFRNADLSSGGEAQKSEGGEKQRAWSPELQPKQIRNSQSEIRNVQYGWNSNTDTEVILRAYTKWGKDCVTRLRGMFAFAIWDESKQELFLARDPFGIKPLYYYETDRLFIFASEVRAVLASGLVPRRLSRKGLGSYLQFGSVQDPLTMIDGVRTLLPGHFLVAKLKDDRLGVQVSKYSPDLNPESEATGISSRNDAVALLRSKLEDSVRHHLVSDVPLGAFLSGGIDSSAIVALMSQVAGQRPKTFSVVFEESDFSEGEQAKLVARRFETEHHEILLSEHRLLDMLPGALTAMDQPTMDGINTYVVSKAVKEAGITVALSGLGGDELFAGYPSFRRAIQLNRLATAPFAMRHFASTAGRMFTNGSSRYRKFWDLVESDCSPAAAYSISRQLFSPSEITGLMSDGSGYHVSGFSGSSHGFLRRPETRNPTPETDVINAVSLLELTGYMANTLLRDTDQMSMAHALEVRVPFVDSEVINYVMALPGNWKVNGGRPKPLLVDALGDLLPEEIWRRRKMGFTLPFQRWMCSRLANDIDEMFSDTENLTRVGIEPDHACSAWHAFKKNPQQQPWSRPWALYVLRKWCEINNVHV